MQEIIIESKKEKTMQQAQHGDKVKVHYHGKLRSGETFDSSQGRDPLEFELGSGQVIKGFDEGIKGMQVGDKKTIEIAVVDAYGEKQQEMIIEFPKDQFPPDMNPEAGMQLMMSNGSGQQFPVTIVDVKEESVILDANHPLAGQELIFDLELVEITPKSRIIMP
jgi:FKBP-type peptidyl-prolyl cis-trans isomerase 2